jgi:hypothetical protein
MHDGAHTEIMRLPARLAWAAWPEVAPHIAPAVEMSEGRHTLATTLEAVQSCEMQAFVALRDAKPIMGCITRIALYPAQKWLQIPFCGGHDMRAWLEPLLNVIDDLAVAEMCSGIEIFGRKGWTRALAPYGYRRGEHTDELIKRVGFGVRAGSMERAA